MVRGEGDGATTDWMAQGERAYYYYVSCCDLFLKDHKINTRHIDLLLRLSVVFARTFDGAVTVFDGKMGKLRFSGLKLGASQ